IYLYLYFSIFPGPRTNGDRLLAKLKLQPWINYTFHVVARNALGNSNRSQFTSEPCNTPQTIPFNNPLNVCTDSRSPRQLIITWQVKLFNCNPDCQFLFSLQLHRENIPQYRPTPFLHFSERYTLTTIC